MQLGSRNQRWRGGAKWDHLVKMMCFIIATKRQWVRTTIDSRRIFAKEQQQLDYLIVFNTLEEKNDFQNLLNVNRLQALRTDGVQLTQRTLTMQRRFLRMQILQVIAIFVHLSMTFDVLNLKYRHKSTFIAYVLLWEADSFIKISIDLLEPDYWISSRIAGIRTSIRVRISRDALHREHRSGCEIIVDLKIFLVHLITFYWFLTRIIRTHCSSQPLSTFIDLSKRIFLNKRVLRILIDKIVFGTSSRNIFMMTI